MRMAVLETLRSYNVKPLSKDWRNPSQVQLEGLTRCIFRTSEAFLGSKFTVQSQTISIYPSEPEELKIQSAYMFTLGLFSETTVRRDGSPSTHLWPASVVTLVQDCLTSDRGDSECRSLFKVMRHLSACERQLRQYPAFPEGVTSEFHAILASPSCQRWQKMETTQGRPLLLHGQSYSQLLNIANCIIEHQRSDMERGRYGTKVKRQVLAFEFDSADPARNSIHGMVSSLIAQLVKLPELMDSMAYETLHANYTLGGGWTLESLFNLLEASDFYGRHGIFLIHRLDHCEPLSCSKFLEHYMSASSRYEHRRRIIVTTQNSESVSNQKFPWISIGVDDAVPPATQHWDALADSLAQAYPFKEEREQVREALSRIALVKEERQVALQIIQLHTSWPEDTSRECLAKFIEFSKVCHPMDTSATILGKILRDLADPELVQWVVMWLDRPCRPLYRQELMTILSESVRVNLPSSDLSLKPLTETRRMTRSLLRILVEPDMERLILRPQIRQMLATLCSEKSAPTWYEVEKKAHEMITVFTQHFLTLAPVRENLKNELEEYNASNLDSGLRYQAPLCPEGLGVEFKLLESLPYHLLHSQPTQPTALLDNILWTRAYWAITNPFTRGPCPTETFQMKLPEFATMIACQPNDIVSIRRARYLASSPSDLMGAFRRSMLASDQDNAVFFASEVSKLSHAPGAKNAWLRQSLWAAALQGMPDVVEVLLMNNGLDLNRCSDLNDSNDDDTDSSVTTMRVLRKHWTSPIAVAIYFGHFEVVELLLRHESRLHVHVGEASLRRVVGAAVPFGHTKVLQKVLHTAPGLLDSPDELQYLLHRAAACGSIGILPEILNIIPHKSLCLGSGAVPEEQKHEANPIEKKPLYETESPLYAACASRWPGVTSILLERNATPEQCSETSEIAKALWCSMEEFPSLECVEQLLRHGADPNENLNLDEMPAFIEHIHRSLEYPEESPSEEFLVEMLDAFLMGPKGLRVNASSKQTGNTALTTASWFCSRAVVEWLLEHGAEVDAVDEQGLSALHYAVARNHVTIVRALLDRTSTSQLDAIAKGGDAAILAHAYASPEITDMLLDRGVDVNAQDGNGCTALYCAVLNGLDSEDIVRKLLARGADTAIRVKDGWSPLATAVSNGVTPIVRLLVDAGASPEDVVNGYSLVHLAARHVEVLRIILEFHNRVNVNHKDDDGWTPLMWAASWEEPQEGSAEHLRLLLRAGADTKAQDSDGQTVLHKAARAGVASNMAVLLACPDIDVNQTSRGRWGSTPLTVACDWGHLQVAEMLLVHSADVNVSCLANFRYPTALISACSCNRFS
jgi:ankyrin repeat protein